MEPDPYRRMNGMSLQEMDQIIDTVCSLCRNHEKAGFVEGIKIGMSDKNIGTSI